MSEKGIKNVFQNGGDLLLKFEITHPKIAPITYTLGSCLFFVIVSVGVKMLQHIGSSQILYFRSTFSFIFSTTFMQQGGYSPFVANKETHKILMFRCVLGGISHYCYFKALHILGISDAMTIFLTSPIWTSLLAGVFLHEKLTLRLWLSIGISFAGILFVIQPDFLKELFGVISSVTNEDQSERIFGFENGIAYALISSIMTIIIRSLSGKVHNSVVIHYVLISSYMISTVDLISKGEFNADIFQFSNMKWIVFIAFFNYAGQMFFSRALFIEKATKLAPFTYSTVVFGFIFEVLLFNKEINLISLFGSALVILGNFEIATAK